MSVSDVGPALRVEDSVNGDIPCAQCKRPAEFMTVDGFDSQLVCRDYPYCRLDGGVNTIEQGPWKACLDDVSDFAELEKEEK